MMDEIMLSVEGSLPMGIPLQDDVLCCLPLVKTSPEQKLMKFAESLEIHLVSFFSRLGSFYSYLTFRMALDPISSQDSLFLARSVSWHSGSLPGRDKPGCPVAASIVFGYSLHSGHFR